MMTMKSERVLVLSAITALASISCASVDSTTSEDKPAVRAAAVENGTNATLRIEKAERALDRGEDAARIKADMEALIADPAATVAEKDEAHLALSRAFEAAGDKEAAIVEVEKLLESHAADREWAASKEATKRLRKLLTGKEEEPRTRLSAVGPVAPITSQLMSFFPADPAGITNFRMLRFGGDQMRSEKLGTFNVAETVRQSRGKSCPNCRGNVNSETQSHNWVGIAAHRKELNNALVVFYFDLEEGRIPARYDALLPMPSAEIVAKISKGEGLIAVREQQGAPPVILIAAPRFAQLDDVESELAKLNALPKAPMSVTLPGSLEPEEIQDVVRASFSEFRVCYEARLQQDPAAAGKVTLNFQIEPDGHVTNAKATSNTASIASLETCLVAATERFVFPAAQKMTTVGYPVEFSPGD